MSRFNLAVGSAPAVAAGQPRRLAYADPPYPGKAHLYRDHPDYGGEVDHAELIDRLCASYDAWALSTSSKALARVLRLCPDDVLVGSWNRGGRAHRDALMPVTAWEPVIYWGAIASAPTRRAAPVPHDASSSPDTATLPVDSTRYDALVLGVNARTTDTGRVIGAKPAGFARWVFQLLDARPCDTLEDIYPGSGGIGRAWAQYVSGRSSATAERPGLPVGGSAGAL